MQKIKRIVESQARIPKIIVIKDQHGNEQEYEVLEESEEEENSVNLSVNLRSGDGDRNIKVKNNGLRDNQE